MYVAVADAKSATAPREELAAVGDRRRVLLAGGYADNAVALQRSHPDRCLAREPVAQTELACCERGRKQTWWRFSIIPGIEAPVPGVVTDLCR